jgi:hypothetical protein
MERISTLSCQSNIGQKDVWVNCTDLETIGSISYLGKAGEKRPDTVGELKSAEIWMSHMPSLKAKKLVKLTQEKAVPER